MTEADRTIDFASSSALTGFREELRTFFAVQVKKAGKGDHPQLDKINLKGMVAIQDITQEGSATDTNLVHAMTALREIGNTYPDLKEEAGSLRD
ncbi:MAG: hypothetical protein ABIH35_04925 [Patescibacteria group bacterium]